MRAKVLFFKLLLLTCFSLVCGPVLATTALPTTALPTTLEALQANGQLRLEASLQSTRQAGGVSDTGLIVGQPLVVTVEVATDRWFAKGSRVEPFEVANAVILPTSELAVNSSERIGGQTWAIQLREVTLYPTQAGRYEIPALSIFISVNAQEGIVEGVLKTQPMMVDVRLPEALEGVEPFVVSSDFSLTVSGDLDEQRVYQVGQAITRTVTLSAADIPAMMLPVLSVPAQTGLSIYHKPPKVQDKSNRGERVGVREQTHTFIFEAAGDFVIPEQTIYWWNTDSQSLSTVTVDEWRWQVEGASPSLAERLQQWDYVIRWQQLASLACVMALTYLSSFLFVRRKKLWPAFVRNYRRLSRQAQRRQRRQYRTAIAAQDYVGATDCLYRLHGLPRGALCQLRAVYQGDEQRLDLLQRLMTLAYGGQSTPVDTASLPPPNANLLLKLGVPSSAQAQGRAMTRLTP